MKNTMPHQPRLRPVSWAASPLTPRGCSLWAMLITCIPLFYVCLMAFQPPVHGPTDAKHEGKEQPNGGNTDVDHQPNHGHAHRCRQQNRPVAGAGKMNMLLLLSLVF